MKIIEVGAFEAKTHFSQLLREVERGSLIHVTRRGKPVAVIGPETTDSSEALLKVLDRIAARRSVIHSRERISRGEILRFRDGGRK